MMEFGLLAAAAAALSGAAFTALDEAPVAADGGSSRGLAWGDFDNDGDPDLAISNTDNQPIFVYRNDREAGFARLAAPIDRPKGHAEGISFVDIDNDGWLDLFVARTEGGNLLFRNEQGRLAVGEAGPLTGESDVYSEGCWADFDNDGWLDVFMVTRGARADVLFRNVRGKTFEPVRAPFADDRTDGRTCIAADFNDDRLPDIFVGNFIEHDGERTLKATDAFYVNRGGFAFDRVVRGHAVNTPRLTYGLAAEDVDQDGDLDLFVGAISLSDRNVFYENLGAARFYPREDLAISKNGLGPSKGATWGDFTCDGGLDLYVAEGTEDITREEKAGGYDARNAFFMREGEAFVLSSAGAAAASEAISAGAAWADFDLDGDLDLAVANWGGNDENNALYRNDTSCRQWLGVALEGRRSNRMGVGARVYLTLRDGDERKSLNRTLILQTGYASANEPLLHFGFGGAAVVETLTVEWPSGAVDVLDDVEAGRRIRIVEGDGAVAQEDGSARNP